ncbi:hypothetical protein BO86DRAFT_391444 [Aspergillus japonicus CBS 114.51]|uniref:Uncharacterized protein n=1 Tax=Aspergillus japonicus CBS 114.51 TaxID=1448312 RepID=A0A8T8WU41_ASPJA|nr:hypothetical protein BO86DRAFT_391444 [Aspergillus japonicus CBS 114.51]RAH78992.1 hypothetical protein BO86DRAFT_391444 [Aspergillus japonicus CBS 114.51]
MKRARKTGSTLAALSLGLKSLEEPGRGKDHLQFDRMAFRQIRHPFLTPRDGWMRQPELIESVQCIQLTSAVCLPFLSLVRSTGKEMERKDEGRGCEGLVSLNTR